MTDLQELMALLEKALSYDPNSGVFTWLVDVSYQRPAGSRAGGLSSAGYRKIKIAGKWYLEHRLAVVIMTGKFPRFQVDHVNGDRTDNRWVNIRECTSADNKQNRAARTARGHIGTWCDRRRGTWGARITARGVTHHLGTFATEDEAIAAYLAGKRKHHKFSPSVRESHAQRHGRGEG